MWPTRKTSWAWRIIKLGVLTTLSRVLNASSEIYQMLLESSGSDLHRMLKIQAEFQLAIMQLYENRFTDCKAVCATIQKEINRREFAALTRQALNILERGRRPCWRRRTG